MKLTKEKLLESMQLTLTDSHYLNLFPALERKDWSSLGYTATTNQDSKIFRLFKILSLALEEHLHEYRKPDCSMSELLNDSTENNQKIENGKHYISSKENEAFLDGVNYERNRQKDRQLSQPQINEFLEKENQKLKETLLYITNREASKLEKITYSDGSSSDMSYHDELARYIAKAQDTLDWADKERTRK